MKLCLYGRFYLRSIKIRVHEILLLLKWFSRNSLFFSLWQLDELTKNNLYTLQEVPVPPEPARPGVIDLTGSQQRAASASAASKRQQTSQHSEAGGRTDRRVGSGGSSHQQQTGARQPAASKRSRSVGGVIEINWWATHETPRDLISLMQPLSWWSVTRKKKNRALCLWGEKWKSEEWWLYDGCKIQSSTILLKSKKINCYLVYFTQPCKFCWIFFLSIVL